MNTARNWTQAVADGWPLLDLLEDGVATILPSGAVARSNAAFRQLVGRDRLRTPQLARVLLQQCLEGEKVPGRWEEVRVPLAEPHVTLRRLTIAVDRTPGTNSPRWILVLKDTSCEASIQEKYRESLAVERRANRNLKRLLVSTALLLVFIGAAVGRGYYVVYRKYDIPPVPVQRTGTTEELARGEKVFTAACGGCHMVGGDVRMADIPQEGLSTVVSSNISSDANGGVGSWKDEEIARAIRYGVRKDGHLTIGMPGFDMLADSDIAAVVSFMRSGHEAFAPDPQIRPRPTLTFTGVMSLAYRIGVVSEGRFAPIPAPTTAPSPEYGAYLAKAVYRCWTCHTEGVARDRYTRPDAFAGGFQFIDEQGRAIYSSNLTSHERALGKWSLGDFTRTVRDGVGPDGFIVQPPMQRFRFIDNEEMEALFKFFQALPKIDKPNRAGGVPMMKIAPTASPDVLYAQLGCRLCHGWKAPFDARVRQAATKPVSAVANWIRNPQQFNPGTQMPTFAGLIDESQALALAEWLRRPVVLSTSPAAQ